MCPIVQDQTTLVKFNSDTKIATQKMDTIIDQKLYQFTFSMTLRVDETTCKTRNPIEAAETCNVFMLSDAFMLYFEMENMARFHFFASKNYYESQSKAFFIPYDQFVTIQLTIQRWEGYQIVVGDQNGKVFYSKEEARDMQEMWVTRNVQLLHSFQGVVEHFALDDVYHELSTDYVRDFREDQNMLYNVRFEKSKIQKGLIENMGSEPLLQFVTNYQLVHTFFQVPKKGLVGGTLEAEPLFDGIACNDRHITT